MPGWIRKNGAYRQISVPEFYEVATATVTSGGTGYTTAMELVIDPVNTGDHSAIIAIDEVGDNGEIVAYHIAERGKYALESTIIHPTYTVEGGTHTGTDAQITLTAETYTGLNTAVFARVDDEWQPVNAVYMKKGNNWRLLYEPAPAQPNPPEPVVTVAVKYIAIGADGKVSVSDDGYAYTEKSTIEPSGTAGIGGSGRILFYDPDTEYYYTALKNKSTSEAKRTKDGVTWENLNIPNNLSMAVFAKGGDGNFMFISQNDNRAYYTTDPINGTWSTVYITNTGLDWNSLFWADLGIDNKYWYVSANSSTTAYKFMINGTVSSLTLTNKYSAGRLGLCNKLLYYPYAWNGYATSSSRVRTYVECHSVSWDGITFNQTYTYGQTASSAGDKNSMVYNNGVYCSNRYSLGNTVFSYFLNAWVPYTLQTVNYGLTVLMGNFCWFHLGKINQMSVSKSADGQNWTSVQPTLPVEIVGGQLWEIARVGLRFYSSHQVIDSGGFPREYDYVVATADGTAFNLVTGIDSESLHNYEYAMASKMG